MSRFKNNFIQFVNQSAKIIILALLTAIFFQFPAVSDARTIALVYDDSGSMKGKNKWVYANYASQSLAALLRQDEDRLAAVLMSAPGNVRQMGVGQKVLNTIRQQWGARGETPYKSVETAMGELLKSATKLVQVSGSKLVQVSDLNQPSVFDKQKQDWLIVMTDGQFFKSLSDAKQKELKEKVRTEYIEKSKGRIRVVFLLIGSDADRLVPRLWEEVAPEQVDIVTAANEQEIVRKMSDIAAMITGRDFQDTEVVRKEKTIRLTSLFPVRRITVFEQGSSRGLATVEELGIPKLVQVSDPRLVQVSDPRLVQVSDLNQPTMIDSLNIKSPQGNLAGNVTHCRNKSIMPAGEYVIRFNENIEKRAIQVLLETAVDFRVILRDTQGNIKMPDSTGIFKLCQDQTMLADIQFFKAETDEPLSLDTVNTKELKVTVSLNTMKKQLVFDENTHQFTPMEFVVKPRTQTLSVEAKSPGYFHLKSNVLTLEGENCIVNKAMAIRSDNKLNIPYIYSKEPVPISQGIDLQVDEIGGSNRVGSSLRLEPTEQNYQLSAEGIPPGVFIRIKGMQGDSPSDPECKNCIFALQPDETLKLEILRNQEYQQDKPSVITLKIFSDDPMVHWEKDQAQITLMPSPRTITLEPADMQWRVPILDLKQAAPFDVMLKADGKMIAGEELEAWKIAYKVSGRIELDFTPDKTQSFFHLQPLPYWCSTCWTSGGNIQVELNAVGPFSSETCSEIVILNIEDAPWWKKCLKLILTVFFTILFLWWLIGIIRKPRFARGSVITYQRKQSHIESRPRTESLPGSWFSRWMIPYIPEKKTIRKITFTPGSTSGSVTITKEQERNSVTIDGSPQDRPWRHDLKLGRNSTLEEEFGNQVERYTYK